MAFLPEDQARASLSDELPRYTANTITTREAFMAELAAIRRRGFAIDNEERTEGMRCIAAPVFNAYNEAVAGVSLSGPSVRVKLERDAEFGSLIKHAADQITRATGGIVKSLSG